MKPPPRRSSSRQHAMIEHAAILGKSRRLSPLGLILYADDFLWAALKERRMKPIVTRMLRRCLMTLGAIGVWAKALARGKAEPETDQKAAGDRQQTPNREPK